MSPRTTAAKAKKPKKTRYLFKITVIGPDDSLLEEVLHAFSQKVMEVDGIRISAAGHKTDRSDVKALIMSPAFSALDLMLSLSFKGASGVIIVLREPDEETECMYQSEVKLNAGDLPTRTLLVGPRLTEEKSKEIVRLLDDMLEEMVSAREPAGKSKR